MQNEVNDYKIMALAGNPNSGKTTLFNELTGSKQQVGNWPGVTVVKKEGLIDIDNTKIKVVDLPGAYSLTSYSEDESVAKDYIINENYNVIINIIDATNLERNMYLTTQIMETGANVILVLNMIDEVKAKQIDINVKKLSDLLDTPIVPTVATKGEGVKELINLIKIYENNRISNTFKIDYGKEIEQAICKVENIFFFKEELLDKYNSRWIAIQTLEGNKDIIKILNYYGVSDEIVNIRNEAVRRIEEIYGDDIQSIMAEKKYGYISGIVKESTKKKMSLEDRVNISDTIDRLVTNRYLGIPLFLLIMWAIFQLTFTFGEPMVGLIESFSGWIRDKAGILLFNMGASDLIVSLIIDGVIGGIGAVLVFVPNIFLLFFAISILEDSGYMARAAYIMDRFMHTLGLHGKSCIPLIVGLGCNVPAIMATRTLENKKDRLITILINPLMSCSARLPVYVLFTGAFFASKQGLVIFSIYLLGIVLAIAIGILLKNLVFKGEQSQFVMELPPYRIPTLKSTFIHMWERCSSFIRKAGTFIFTVVVIVWVLSNLPVGVEYASDDSYLGHIGGFISPIFKPAGFGTWQATVALLFGILAKEVVVGTLGVVYGVNGEALTNTIAKTWTPLSAYSFMVMTLIYIPCVATIGAIKRETNSWKWTIFAISYSLILGWVMSVVVYQLGSLLGYS